MENSVCSRLTMTQCLLLLAFRLKHRKHLYRASSEITEVTAGRMTIPPTNAKHAVRSLRASGYVTEVARERLPSGGAPRILYSLTPKGEEVADLLAETLPMLCRQSKSEKSEENGSPKYQCSTCQKTSPKWFGHCSDCGAWDACVAVQS